jgi:hypothetical protein
MTSNFHSPIDSNIPVATQIWNQKSTADTQKEASGYLNNDDYLHKSESPEALDEQWTRPKGP